jgi:RimJ/RimL family protein N-acetyltransferase
MIAESFWNKGYAYESSQIFIDYSFNQFNLNKIYLEVLKENDAAINLYQKLGFREEGILKENIFKNGEFKDVLIMSLLRDDLE